MEQLQKLQTKWLTCHHSLTHSTTFALSLLACCKLKKNFARIKNLFSIWTLTVGSASATTAGATSATGTGAGAATGAFGRLVAATLKPSASET